MAKYAEDLFSNSEFDMASVIVNIFSFKTIFFAKFKCIIKSLFGFNTKGSIFRTLDLVRFEFYNFGNEDQTSRGYLPKPNSK